MLIRLGTRGSHLARTQSGHIADALRALGHEVEIIIVRTEGDTNLKPLSQLGGIGVFAAALRTAILDGDVDIAVHSYKDLPTAAVPGLVVAAIPPRRDPGDVLCSRAGGVDALPLAARVGTGSPRRTAQLLARRGDLQVVDIRGNVETRLARVAEGDLHAVVLAAAGLDRLNLLGAATEHLDVAPAPAQGALAVECREDAAELRGALAAIDDPASRYTATAERAILAGLSAGCAAPIGASSRFDGDEYTLRGLVLSTDGRHQVSAECVADRRVDLASDVGARVAELLLVAGAAEITELQAITQTKLADFHHA